MSSTNSSVNASEMHSAPPATIAAAVPALIAESIPAGRPGRVSNSGSTPPQSELVVRKRRRVPVVCAVCRQRKLKCDRNLPCSACVAHETAALCTYAVKPWVGEQVFTQTANTSSALPPSGVPTTATTGLANVVTAITPSSAVSAYDAVLATCAAPNNSATSRRKRARPRTEAELDPKLSPAYIELQQRMARMESLLQQMSATPNGANATAATILDPSVTVPAIPTAAFLPTPANQILQSMPGFTPQIAGIGADVAPQISRLSLSALMRPTSLASAPVPVLNAEMSVKRNRLTYFGAFSGLAAIRKDEYIQKCISQVEQAKRIMTRKRVEARAAGNSVGPEKGQTSHDTAPPRKVTYIPPEMKTLVEDIFNVQAEPVDLFPRLEHRPVCEFLVDRFMQTINIVFPVVNPYLFRKDMAMYWKAKDTALQRRQNNNNNSSAVVQSNGAPESSFGSAMRKTDMRSAAFFAVILRLGRLSLPSDWKPSSAGFEDSYSVLFGPRLIAFAWACLRETNYMGKPNLVVAQVLVCMRLHQLMSFEGGDGHDGSDAAGFTGMMCQIGVSMGLHRDPSMFPCIPPGMGHLGRTLWTNMVILDTYRTLDLMLPFAINLETSDCDFDKLKEFPPVVPESDQYSLQFVQSHLKWALLARTIFSRLLRPGQSSLTFEEYCKFEQDLKSFAELHLSSFQSLISVIQVGAAVSSPQDSYDLIQKFLLQILFFRLQLVLLQAYIPADAVTMESIRRERMRCALRMLDTISTCIHHRSLFAGFEWLLIPASERHFFTSFAIVMNGLLKAHYANPTALLPPIPPESSWTPGAMPCDPTDLRWLSPDLTFHYDDASLLSLQRLYQAFVKTQTWLKEYSTIYYNAHKTSVGVRVLSDFVRHEVVLGRSKATSQGNEPQLPGVDAAPGTVAEKRQMEQHLQCKMQTLQQTDELRDFIVPTPTDRAAVVSTPMQRVPSPAPVNVTTTNAAIKSSSTVTVDDDGFDDVVAQIFGNDDDEIMSTFKAFDPADCPDGSTFENWTDFAATTAGVTGDTSDAGTVAGGQFSSTEDADGILAREDIFAGFGSLYAYS
ncbi:uncharacterized protein V1518DRAFT_387743 [Limtongia smithiae]|uniref:uncharacterized protein n=1 Tax=Limtongia smithiae TaxID=1125753 RepID=UPI0034CEAA4C